MRYVETLWFFGALYFYTSLSFFFNSPFTLILALIIAVLAIAYLKIIEEKELELRFGRAYLAYKKSTPFLIPDITRAFRRRKA